MAADLWLSPLSTLAGATAAILGGSITSWINDWRRDARDRKQLAASLAGELRGFKTLFDMYQPGVKLRRLETQTDGRFVETLAGVIPLRGVYFQVFDANASKIGLLSPDLADSVSVVYVLLRALSEEFPRLEEFHKQRMGPENLENFHEQLISLTKEVGERTERVIGNLRIYAGLPPD